MFLILLGGSLSGALAITAPLEAQEGVRSGSTDAAKKLYACLEIEDDAQRLTCYDREVRSFSQAQTSGQVIVAERKDVEQARRELFGLSLSENPLFADKDDEGVNSITATVTAVRQTRDGKWIMALDTGARWMQTEARRTRRGPRKGDVIEISRGAFGAFVAKPEGGRAFKVKRLN
ncbi:hypothetical protein [Alterisphingorhabdus coralli]|uniref:Uncharacterized protein n=1 Tax=Alterisphingorhabdus coralli TaxID=3071408 RepID=A0AA97F9H9_9SPHN|nr:hypothetical protein [Parasphingorhabdus sp. SCSIO 66989]WOE75743.1 hypothetical protein RB602_03250 [Parasphingorhabdus sp. SCSIO 66989]